MMGAPFSVSHARATSLWPSLSFVALTLEEGKETEQGKADRERMMNGGAARRREKQEKKEGGKTGEVGM